MVGFLFLKTRLLGVPIPFHRNFAEVNLRFYVRRHGADGWRRGVVFVKEIVPRRAIAAVAQLCYGERYVALPMRHHVDTDDLGHLVSNGCVRFEWQHQDRWHRLAAGTIGQPALPPPGSEAEFITEHYWGYAPQRHGGTAEYRVEHPQWRVWQTTDAVCDCSADSLYGTEFADRLQGLPSSAFVAEGSAVTVRQGSRITP